MSSKCNSNPEEIISAVRSIESSEQAFENALKVIVTSADKDAGKFSKFVNGGVTEEVQLGTGQATPTLRNVVHLVKSAASTLDSSDVSGKFSDAVNGGTELRTLAERFGDVVNIKDFGANGDGEANDTSAYAVWKAAVANGGIGFVPHGEYIRDSVSTFLNGKGVLSNIVVDGFSYPSHTEAKLEKLATIEDNISYIPQTYCTDGSYIYSFSITADNASQKIKKLSLATGQIVASVDHEDLSHCNASCCDDSYIYITKNNKILKLDKLSLSTVGSVEVSDAIGNINGIACGDGKFWVQSYDNNYIYELDSLFQVSKKIAYPLPQDGFSFQDISYYKGNLYAFVFCSYANRPSGYSCWYCRLNWDGTIQEAFQIPAYREVEGIDFLDDKFLVGITSRYASPQVFNFYTWDVFGKEVYQEKCFTKSLQDEINGLDFFVYVTKNNDKSTTGSGTKQDPLHRIEDAVEFARNLSNRAFNIRIVVSGDFSDVPDGILIRNCNTPLWFQTGEEYGCLPSVTIDRSAFVRFDCPIKLTNSSTKDYGIQAAGANVVLGDCQIENTSSKIDTNGVRLDCSQCSILSGDFSVSGFSVGINAHFSHVASVENYTLSNCDTPLFNYCSTIQTHTNRILTEGFLARSGGGRFLTESVAVYGAESLYESGDVLSLNTLQTKFVSLPNNCTIRSVVIQKKCYDPSAFDVSLGDITNSGEVGQRGFNVQWKQFNDAPCAIFWIAMISF